LKFIRLSFVIIDIDNLIKSENLPGCAVLAGSVAGIITHKGKAIYHFIKAIYHFSFIQFETLKLFAKSN